MTEVKMLEINSEEIEEIIIEQVKKKVKVLIYRCNVCNEIIGKANEELFLNASKHTYGPIKKEPGKKVIMISHEHSPQNRDTVMVCSTECGLKHIEMMSKVSK